MTEPDANPALDDLDTVLTTEETTTSALRGAMFEGSQRQEFLMLAK